MSLPLDPERLLQMPLMAHLATVCEQGPRHSPVWFLWEDAAVWIVSMMNESITSRVQADPRCSIGIVEFDNDAGILRHVGMRGRADVCPLDVARRDRLLAKYIGADQSRWPDEFRKAAIDTIDCLIRFIPDGSHAIVSREQSYFSANSPYSYG
jgi:hypothetical protein